MEGSQSAGNPQQSAGAAPSVASSAAVRSHPASSGLFTHIHHPHIARRKEQGPVKVADQMDKSNRIARLNTRFALLVTVAVGSMWCAYLFTLLALVSLPDALRSGKSIIIVAWVAQTFIQLVLLPIIIVGQNIQASASDHRAQQTYEDAEAVLHEAEQIQQHLSAQDDELQAQGKRLRDIISALEKAYPQALSDLEAASSE